MRQIAADGRVRIEIYPRDDVHNNEARRRFVDDVRSVAPGATDSSVMLLESTDAIIKAFAEAGSIALGLIVVLLAIVLRNVWEIGLVLAPLLLAAVLTIGLAVLLGLSFNFANIIVLPLLLGMGVDSAIHFVMREHAVSGAGAVLRSSTSRAVLFSALTTIASFGSLAISTHRGMSSMGPEQVPSKMGPGWMCYANGTIRQYETFE